MSVEELIQPIIKKGLNSHLIDILTEKNPNHQYDHAPGGKVKVDEEAADVRHQREYFEGKRKRKPNALSLAKALEKQEKRVGDGTFVNDHITPAIHEKLVERLSTPGSFQRHIPRQIKH